ncbi:hypothetical protein MPL1032_180100 [Mesorhizobium plurifarium]|uniref:Transposase for insertion sequence element IS21-like C-terminal domain-containing protein n=1 Tax=Mesorhizobium plurifarium TaxID=69974 RepID=A0A0K2VU91_MESPL|nr:hypothetical protein MPL1032_180100 [Mesorhizobium plurifarium]
MVLDNLKEGVLKPDLYEPELNPIYSAMLAHYGVVADPARVADPNRKGSVENAIQHTQGTALAGRRFETLEAQNEFLRHWEENWASKRIHGSTRRQVEAMFQEEKPHLRPLPVAPFRMFTEVVRTVCDDTTVRVDNSFYAARPALIGSQVNVRVYASTIEIRDRHTHALLRVHSRMTHPGSVVLPTNERPFNPSRQTAVLLANAGRIGPQTRALCQHMFDAEGRPGQRAMWGIVGLSRKYPTRLVEQACAHAISNGIYRYRHVRATVERLFEQALEQVEEARQPASQLTQDHPLIRAPAEYGDLFSRAVRHEAGNHGGQPGDHDDRAPAIRAHGACATKQVPDLPIMASDGNVTGPPHQRSGQERCGLSGANEGAFDAVRNTPRRDAICRHGEQNRANPGHEAGQPTYHPAHDSRPPPACGRRYQYDPRLARPRVVGHHTHLRRGGSGNESQGVGEGRHQRFERASAAAISAVIDDIPESVVGSNRHLFMLWPEPRRAPKSLARPTAAT